MPWRFEGGIVDRAPRPTAVRALLIVEAMCAFFGYLGGVMFFVDPSGKSWGLDFALKSLPVDDFLLVGLWLFVVYGVGFSIVTYALRMRKSWGWITALGLSVVWVGWIAVETYLMGVSPFIDIWLVPPILGLVLLFLPSVRRPLVAHAAKTFS